MDVCGKCHINLLVHVLHLLACVRKQHSHLVTFTVTAWFGAVGQTHFERTPLYTRQFL